MAHGPLVCFLFSLLLVFGSLLKFFFVCASVVLYVPHLSFFWCLGGLAYDFGISWVSLAIYL